MSYQHQSGFVLYKRLFRFVFKYWPAFCIAIFGNMMYSGVDSGMTYLLKPILNKGFIAHDIQFVKFLPVIIFGAFVIRGIANMLSNYFMACVSRGVVMDFRQLLFNHLMKLPASFFDNSSSGQILAVIIYNVEQVSSAGSDVVTNLVQSSCLVIGLIAVMFSISWRMSLIFFVTIPIIAMTVHFSSRRLRKMSRRLQEQMGGVTSIAEEAIEGFRVIRAFGGQEYEAEKFYKATLRNQMKEVKVTLTNALAESGVQLVAAVVLSVIIYLATSPTATTMLSPGGFVAMIAAMLALLKPLKNITSINSKIQRGLAGAQSVFEVLDLDVEHDTGTIPVKKAKGDIAFEQVNFTYEGHEKQILHDVSFTVPAGKMVALIGRSGSGKSTMVNLLQRFYKGWTGKILVDGVEIQDYILSDLRQQFASVSQHVTLFNDTVAHNIAYGKFSDASKEEIIAAAKAANAWGFIQELPQGLETIVGDNGVLLSGGQRQRIAIARAILKNASILILDEATSSLDTESEKQIQAAIDQLIKERTTLVIAHRLSTIENADLIVVLDEGRVVETGVHKELLAKNGHYAYLYKMQFNPEED